MPPTIRFGAVAFRLWPGGCETILPDGVSVHAEPQDTAEYRERARVLGYGGDVVAMCREHELAHSALCHWLGLPYSPALWRAAHNDGASHIAGLEEDMVMAVQAFANAAGASLLRRLISQEE